MNGDEKTEILEAISNLKAEIAVLKSEQENTKNYIYKDLKIDIDKVCGKVEACLEKAEKGYIANLRWMATTLIVILLGIVGWIGWFLK